MIHRTDKPSKEVKRVYAWRKKNRKKYNEYQKALMRARRGILQKKG